MGVINLDRKVQFQRFQQRNTPLGLVTEWADLGGPVWAGRRDVSDQEKAAAGSIEATLVSRFTIRSSAFSRDLTPADRLTHDGRTWDIQGIKEAWEGRFRFLEVTARTNG